MTKARCSVLMLCLSAGLAASAHGQTLTPPNGEAFASSWAFPVSYTQMVSGSGSIGAFRLLINAQPTTGGAYHRDAVIELISPNGTVLLLGGDTAGSTYPGSVQWASLPHVGTIPNASGGAQAIDITYDYNFGPVAGQWSFNFRNQYTSGSVPWNDIQIQLLTADPGACCLPDGTCTSVVASGCASQGGTFQGAGSTCGSVVCPQPGACCYSGGGCSVILQTACTSSGGTFHGENTTCAAFCPVPSDKLVPPPFMALGASGGGPWTYSPSYSQTLTGSGDINAVRLVANAASTSSAGVYQSDMQMELVSPNGTVFHIGYTLPTNWTTPGTYVSGAAPASNGNPQFIDATFARDMGPMAGNWSVNFRNAFSGTISWSQIEVIPLSLPSGACCFSDGFCSTGFESMCVANGGVFNGAGTTCATANCPQPTPTEVLPVSHTSITGDEGYNTLVRTGAGNDRTHQVVWSESRLVSTGITPGTVITGLTYRALLIENDMTWPSMEAFFPSYDILIGSAAASPAAMSTSFAGNFSGTPTTVRSGPLTVPAGSFHGSNVFPPAGSPAFPWGFEIVFDTPFTYNGGDLAIETRVMATTSVVNSLWLDSLTDTASSTGALGYRTLAAAGFGAATGTFDFSGTAITKLSVLGGPACYANCDGSTVPPILNVADFTCFLQKFAAGDAYANCDGSTVPPVLNVADFTCFLQKFAAGCL